MHNHNRLRPFICILNLLQFHLEFDGIPPTYTLLFYFQFRCLFEAAFTCKAFTFGINRCLLHNQQWSEVAASSRLSDLLDEDLYEVPDCVQGMFLTGILSDFSQEDKLRTVDFLQEK